MADAPIHRQVAAHLRKYIVKNKLVQGDLLPTELDLCAQFKCSRGTVRKAMAMLTQEGKIRRKPGAGTFVAQPPESPRTPALAAIVPNFMNAEIVRFAQVLAYTASCKGYTLRVAATEYTPDMERQFVDEVAQLHAVGVVKFPTNVKYEEEMRAHLRGRGLPYVMVNDFWSDRAGEHHVAYDERVAVRLAVEHLVELGHERMGLVDYADEPRYGAIEAFTSLLKSHGLPHDREQLLLRHPDQELSPLGDVGSQWRGAPTAYITLYDVLAFDLLAQLRKYGVRTPEDVSVVNVNGPALYAPHGVELTTAMPPNEKMAEKVVDILLNGQQRGHVENHVYEPDFHLGRTSGPCPSDGPGERYGAAVEVGTAHARMGEGAP